MDKKIFIYSLEINNKNQLSLFPSKSLSDVLDTLSKKFNYSDRIQVDKKFIIEMKSFDKNHIFGTFGKPNHFDQGDLVQGRNPQNYYVEPIDSLVENFTYFYLDVNKNAIALIGKSGLPNFPKSFKSFIGTHFNLTSSYEINVVPKKSDEISNFIGKEIPIKKIKLKYTESLPPSNEYLSCQEIVKFDASTIKHASLNLTFKENSVGVLNKIKNLIKHDKITEVSIETDEEIINVVENLISKKITINIDSDEIIHSEKIKNMLMDILAEHS